MKMIVERNYLIMIATLLIANGNKFNAKDNPP